MLPPVELSPRIPLCALIIPEPDMVPFAVTLNEPSEVSWPVLPITSTGPACVDEIENPTAEPDVSDGVTNWSVPPTIAWVVVLDAVSDTFKGLPDWKPCIVTVTFAGIFSAVMVGARFTGCRMTLPPVATPPEVCRFPSSRPCCCSVTIELVTAGSVRSRLVSIGAWPVTLIVSLPFRVMALAGRAPVLKIRTPPLTVAVFVGVFAAILFPP